MATNKLILIAIALASWAATSAVRNDAVVPEHEFVEGLLSVAVEAVPRWWPDQYPDGEETRPTKVYTIGDIGYAKTCITATGQYDHTKTVGGVPGDGDLDQLNYQGGAWDKPFVSCWQKQELGGTSFTGSAFYVGLNDYCWSNSYDAGVNKQCAAQCVPQNQDNPQNLENWKSQTYWKSVEWYYVNPHETCGLPCDKMFKAPLTSSGKEVCGDIGEGNTCITATGPYDHRKATTKVSMDQPFVTCWQYDGTQKYCWSNSYDAGDGYTARCEPQGSAGMWKSVEWYYVNPHQTCGSPCDKMQYCTKDACYHNTGMK